MDAVNEIAVLKMISPGDVVLDIGGWARPFNRANYVIDQGPYETRGAWYRDNFSLAAQGGAVEHFTKDTWITRDICSREPFPFEDKSIDFVICSHTLEDIRDPLWVSSEMNRIGRKGYIEVPSREYESSITRHGERMVGLAHHRWLIDIDQAQSSITFTMKSHLIHASWKYHLPPAYFQRLKSRKHVQYLFWENSFFAAEKQFVGEESIVQDLEAFVHIHRAYYPIRYTLDDGWSKVRQSQFPGRRMLGRIRRAAIANFF